MEGSEDWKANLIPWKETADEMDKMRSIKKLKNWEDMN